MMKINIKWISPSIWYCNNCETYLDDNKEEMEMHSCEEINESNKLQASSNKLLDIRSGII